MPSAKVWTPRSAAFAAAGLLVFLVTLTWWLWQGGTRGAEIANVLALPVSLAGVALSLGGVISRPNASDRAVLLRSARALAGKVASDAGATQQRMLTDAGDVLAADVAFAQLPMAERLWRSDGGSTGATLREVLPFYRELRRGRLVIVGEPGAGKTVLATQLLLDIIADLPPEDPPTGPLTVPVLMSLPTFPAGGDVVGFHDWICDFLTSYYGCPDKIARALVAGGWVLPVLDGLDEMETEDGDVSRALAVVAALNTKDGTAVRAVVVTCRRDWYNRLSKRGFAGADRPFVQDATAVAVDILAPPQIREWLAHRFPGPAGDRFGGLLQKIESSPRSSLAQCLGSPLMLHLLAVAYADPEAQPGELIGKSKAKIRAHLLDQLLPAAAATYPLQDGTRNDPDALKGWLRTLAGHLSVMSGRGSSGSDLKIYEIWQSRAPGVLLRLAGTAVFVAAIAGFFLLASQFVDWRRYQHPHGLMPIVVVVLAAQAIVVGALTSFLPAALLRRLDTAALRRPPYWIFTGVVLTSGLAATLWSPLTFAFPEALILVVCLTLFVVRGVRPGPVRRPSIVIRQQMLYDSVFVVITGLMFSVLIGYLPGAVPGAAVPLATRLTAGFFFGIGFGLHGRASSPMIKYGAYCVANLVARWLPSRPARFLDWALVAGLFRTAGVAVQFRNDELRARLADPAGSGTPVSRGRRSRRTEPAG